MHPAPAGSAAWATIRAVRGMGGAVDRTRVRAWRPPAARGARRGRPGWGAAAWLVLAVLISLAVRLPFLSLPLIADEGGYAYVAERWAAGEGRLYHDLWVSRPQGIFVAYLAIFRTLGADATAIRLGAWVAAALTLLAVWAFGRRWAGPRVAAASSLVFALLAGSPAIEGYTANAEIFMALPAAVAAWLLLGASRGGPLRWAAAPLVGAGVAVGVATLLKPSGAAMLPVALAFAALAGPAALPRREVARRWGLLGGGCAVALLPAIAHGAWLGWDSYLYAALLYRVGSQSSATVPPLEHLRHVFWLAVRCWPLAALAVSLVLLTHRGRLRRGPLGLRGRTWEPRLVMPGVRVGLVAARAAPAWSVGLRAPVGSSTAGRGSLLVRLWLLGSVAGVAVGGDWWPHYLVQGAAPAALWVGRRLGDLTGGNGGPIWRRVAVVGLAAAALLAPYRVVLETDGDPGRLSLAVHDQPVLPVQDEVAAYLRATTPAGAAIFVAFDEAELYYLADRPAAYRHLYDQELAAIPGAEAALLDLIGGPARPAVVVATRQLAPFPDQGRAFWAAVRAHYRLETTIGGVGIYRATAPSGGPSAR